MSHNHNNNNVHLHLPTNDDDFIAKLTHQMSHFMLQQHIHDSSNIERPWDITDSPDSTLWSPVSEESSQEQSPPATPCWKTNEFETNTMMMKLNDERKVSKLNHSYEIQNSNISSHQTLIEEQIRAIEIRKHHALSRPNYKWVDGQGPVFQTRPCPPRSNPVQTGGSVMRAVFIGGSGSRSGTGVFLPRAGTIAPSESTKIKQGKGCSTVLIPARVVHALQQQQHFHKTAATSTPKVVAFPPLRDLVSNREDMYSLKNPPQRSLKALEDDHNDLILPHEWTY